MVDFSGNLPKNYTVSSRADTPDRERSSSLPADIGPSRPMPIPGGSDRVPVPEACHSLPIVRPHHVYNSTPQFPSLSSPDHPLFKKE